MRLTEILSVISGIANKYGFSTPYITGGVVRDRVVGKINEFNDIDITTGDETVKGLAVKTGLALGAKIKEFDDGHISLNFEGVKIDFSSNYRAPGIRRHLQRYGLENPSDIQEECFSRDFTVNSMLWDLDLKNILDPTGRGLPDCRNKIIETCLPARMTLKDNPKRVVRAVYLASKLGFKISEDIIDYVKYNKFILDGEKNRYSRDKLSKAVEYDVKRTVYYMNKMDLWNYFEIPNNLEVIMNKLVAENSNKMDYKKDYGVGIL